MKRILFLHIIILFFTIASYSQNQIPIVEKGVIDLRSWDFEKDGNIALKGEWEFYWEQLLTPKDFKNFNSEKKYISTPATWKKAKTSNNEQINSYGFATYRIIILPPSKNSNDIKFDISAIRSAYKIWINDSLCIEVGNIGKNKNEHKAGITSFNNLFLSQKNNIQSDTIQLVIQVSNYTLPYSAGIKNNIFLGSSSTILKSHNITSLIGYLAIGIFLIIGFYHILMYSFRTKETAILFFGLMSLSVIPRTLFNQRILEDLVLNFNLFWFLIIIGATTFPLFMSLYFYKLYKKEFGKIAIYFFSILSIILSITAFFGPLVSDKITNLYLIGLIAPMIYVAIFVMPKTLKIKEKGAYWAYTGLIIMIVTSINDYIKIIGLTDFPFLASYGFVGFTFLQSINIAKRFASSLFENEKLNKTLIFQNDNLEKIVEERTAEVKQKSEEITAQNETLILQKINIEHAHNQIKASINYAKRIQQAILPFENQIKKDFSEYFILFKPKDVVSGDFYYFKEVNEYLVFAVADCTGHGVPGAFVSMLGISFLNEIVQKIEIKQANQVLEHLRNDIKITLRQTGEINETKDGMDIALCVLNKNTKELQFSGAYNPLYIAKNKSKSTENLTIINADKQPIGIHVKEKPFTNNVIQMEKNDILYLFSDGFPDQNGGDKDTKYKIKNFRNLLSTISNRTLTEQKQILENELYNWQKEKEQRDDITIMGLKL